jgi:glycosyltransferase involved in cell wall biosynthesis
VTEQRDHTAGTLGSELSPAATDVSVVMPSYNSGRFLREAIESVLAQRGPSLELVIQDGRSSDDTAGIVAQISDPRVRFEAGTDGGQSDAVNRAIGRARGQWILWLNADDALAPGALARLWSLAGPDCDLVHGDWELMDANGQPIRRYRCAPMSFDRVIRYGPYIYNGAILARRALYERVGMLDRELHQCMDFDLMLRMSQVARVKSCGDVVAMLRVQPESKSATQAWPQYREHWRVAKRYGAFAPGRLGTTLFSQAYAAAYVVTRPLWYSSIWRTLRTEKRRGGQA